MMAADRRRLDTAEKIDVTRCEAKADRQMAIRRREQALLAAAAQIVPERRWFVVKVAPHREKDVDNSLCAAMVDHWLPLQNGERNRAWAKKNGESKNVWTIAWPGYIFVHMLDLPQAWAGLATVKGIVSALGSDKGPTAIPESIVLKIKAELASGKAAASIEQRGLKEGDAVRVKDGPFASFPGTVATMGEGGHAERARIEVLIFGRVVPVELELAQLAKSD
jgi:transcriptional antiterminator NusG